MTVEPSTQDHRRRIFLMALAIGVTLLFLAMIRPFALSVLIAAILSALVRPLYAVMLRWFRGRATWASMSTVFILVLVVGLPLLAFFGVVATQAVEVSQAAGPWIEQQITHGGPIDQRLRELPLINHVPALQRLVPTSEQLATKAGEAASGMASFLVRSLAQVGLGTLSFFLQLFVMLYALFHFLADGPAILARILYFVPLTPGDQDQLLERFVSVGRATLKGSLLIAVIQGALAGVAFGAVGVPAAAFWGTVTVVASVVPAVGAAIVWVPMVIYLLIAGHGGAATALFLWGALVVSTADNFLRPRLVGRDARMSDLMVLLSTLGGLVLFGAAGFIVGPIVAALFVTAWHLYGQAFAAWLPAQAPEQAEPPPD
ncbi:MAG TPA: AI-2E family transporter [Gemmatimonadaceae bacterium]|nr:AI-2E family transporter [Gemmatimonadaceae bacterium]